MPVIELKEYDRPKDGRKYAFRVSEKGLDGKRRQYKSKAFRTREEAEKAEREYLNKYNGLDDNLHMTFGEAYEKVYEYKKDKIRPTTLKTYTDRIRYLQMLYNVELVDLNEDLYQKWRIEINKTNLSDRYKVDIQKLIITVCKFAEKHWDFNLNKFLNKLESFITPGALKKEMEYYTPEEFQKFLSVIDDIRYRAFFKTLYYCGLRRGEIRGLQWKHVDFFKKKLYVKQQVMNPPKNNANCEWFICDTKTPSSKRTLPLSEDLLKDLQELKEQMKFYDKFSENWFVFGDSDPISQHQMNYHNKIYSEEAGVKKIRLHDFRHSCASVLIHGGTPIPVVSKYLGHSDSTETLETYTHMFEEDLSDVPKYIDSLFNFSENESN